MSLQNKESGGSADAGKVLGFVAWFAALVLVVVLVVIVFSLKYSLDSQWQQQGELESQIHYLGEQVKYYDYALELTLGDNAALANTTKVLYQRNEALESELRSTTTIMCSTTTTTEATTTLARGRGTPNPNLIEPETGWETQNLLCFGQKIVYVRGSTMMTWGEVPCE